ncbi:MAG: OmpA family protein [Gemmatimonadales bacterium]|nr:MAG: OmpA family protein [Gemmatimonadales bacterium]
MKGVIVHRPTGTAAKGVALTLTLLFAAGCGYAKQDDVQRDLADLRSDMRAEMEAGDRAVEERLESRIDAVDRRMEQMETALRDLRDEFEVTVERLENAIRFNAPVHFAFDDDTVRPQDHPVLERFAQTVQAYYPNASITVEGFTDSAGSAAYNQRLGQRRAESVKNFLTTQGLSSEHLRAVSYGESQERQIIPGAAGPGEEGWQNRRVALVIDFNPEGGAARVASTSSEKDGER